jgi:hypothetical protein
MHRFLLFALVACSCATQGTTIEEALMHYHTYLRAQEFSKAMMFVAPEAVEAFQSLHDPQRNIYVVEEVEVGGISEDPKTSNTVVHVQLTVRARNSITVRTKTIREEWHKRKGSWYLVKLSEAESQPQ